MKRLRRNIVLLLVNITIFYSIERFKFGNESFIDISTFVYVLQIGAVLSVVAIPMLSRAPLSVTLIGWFSVYFVGRLILAEERPLIGGMHTYVLITEMTLMFFSITLSYELATRLQDFEEAVENITFANLRNRVFSKEAAMENVQNEIQRSRRYEHKMALALIEPNPESINAVMHRTVQEVQNAMMSRYVALGLANVLDKQRRQSDMLIEHDNKRFVIICPETELNGVKVMLERIRTVAKNQLGVSLFTGCAAFPDDALTYQDLVKHAETNLRPQMIEEETDTINHSDTPPAE